MSRLSGWIASGWELTRRQLRPGSAADLGMRRVVRWLDDLPVAAEMAIFVVVGLIAVAVRVQACALVPAAIWTKDALGYAIPAFAWLDQGEWAFDGRRGPVYSLFIGYGIRFFGGMTGVMIAQHALTVVAIMACVLAARFWFGRSASWIVAPCGLAFAVYGPPIHYAHLVRNESLLFVGASLALSAWAVAIRTRSVAWLSVAGFVAGVLTLIKGVFLPFPVFGIAGAIWLHRARPHIAVLHVALFLAAFLLPSGLERLHRQNVEVILPNRPQSGILLYGRTAQWTVLDGGIEPELKAQIREMVEDYRRLPKLDNNIILKDTVVPRLESILTAQGKSPSDLERLCRRLAFEAIAAHPKEFAAQATRDVKQVLFGLAERRDSLEAGELKTAIRILQTTPNPHKAMDAKRTAAVLEPLATRAHLQPLEGVGSWAWLFPEPPILLSVLAVMLLPLVARGDDRLFWSGQVALLAFTLVLLGTVGRPINRYSVPVMPTMFWVNTAVLVHAWRWLRSEQALIFGRWILEWARTAWRWLESATATGPNAR